MDGTTPVRYSLREEMDHKYLDLKKTLSELSGIAVHCLQLCEVMAACIRVRTYVYVYMYVCMYVCMYVLLEPAAILNAIKL